MKRMPLGVGGGGAFSPFDDSFSLLTGCGRSSTSMSSVSSGVSFLFDFELDSRLFVDGVVVVVVVVETFGFSADDEVSDVCGFFCGGGGGDLAFSSLLMAFEPSEFASVGLVLPLEPVSAACLLSLGLLFCSLLDVASSFRNNDGVTTAFEDGSAFEGELVAAFLVVSSVATVGFVLALCGCSTAAGFSATGLGGCC